MENQTIAQDTTTVAPSSTKKERKPRQSKGTAKNVPAKKQESKKGGATGKSTVQGAAKGKPANAAVGSLAKELILKGKSTDEVLVQVFKKFPDAGTTPKCIAWYRWDLRKKGLLPEVKRVAGSGAGKLSRKEKQDKKVASLKALALAEVRKRNKGEKVDQQVEQLEK